MSKKLQLFSSRSMMSMGSTKPWHDVISVILKQKSPLSSATLLEYYKPVIAWLKNFNNNNHIKTGWNETRRSKYWAPEK